MSRRPIHVNIAPREFDSLAALDRHLRLLGATDVILYGSVARGEATEQSDVDLAVFGPESVMKLIDRLYGFDYPSVTVGGVRRPAQIVTPAVTHTNNPQEFQMMQPEGRSLWAEQPAARAVLPALGRNGNGNQFSRHTRVQAPRVDEAAADAPYALLEQPDDSR